MSPEPGPRTVSRGRLGDAGTRVAMTTTSYADTEKGAEQTVRRLIPVERHGEAAVRLYVGEPSVAVGRRVPMAGCVFAAAVRVRADGTGGETRDPEAADSDVPGGATIRFEARPLRLRRLSRALPTHRHPTKG